MAELSVLALDLGATSGRGVVGRFDGNRLALQEINRFPTAPRLQNGHSYVNFPLLFHNSLQSLQLAATHVPLASIGIDAWGLDMGMLDKYGNLLSDVYHYQDKMNILAAEKAYETHSQETLFTATGSQPNHIKSLFMLLAFRQHNPLLFDRCQSLLHISDLMNFFFCEEKRADRTIIGTSQLYCVQTGLWSDFLMNEFGFSSALFQKETNPGCIIGSLRKEFTDKIDTHPVVTLTCGHDTASAFLASGATAQEAEIVISCGTRALVGTVTQSPNLSLDVLRKGFTNETGFGGSVRLLKSCTGMFLFEQMRLQLSSVGVPDDFDSLMHMVQAAPSGRCLIDPEDLDFWSGEHICDTIRLKLIQSNQPLPESPGEYLRCILESCVCNWAWAIQELKTLMPKPSRVIRVIGGGSKNEFLMQLLASITGIPVLAGPSEGASLGNALTQLYALGELTSIQQMRQVVEHSSRTVVYEPSSDGAEKSIFALYLEKIQGNSDYIECISTQNKVH